MVFTIIDSCTIYSALDLSKHGTVNSIDSFATVYNKEALIVIIIDTYI